MPNKVEKKFISSYSEFQAPLLTYAYYRTNNKETAEDIVQTAFLKTWEYMAYRDRIKNIQSFLYKVVNNLLIDHYRSRKQETDLEEAPLWALVDTRFSEMESTIINKVLLERYINQLDPQKRKIINMRHKRNMKISEISHKTGLKKNYVSVILFNSKKKIKNMFRV